MDNQNRINIVKRHLDEEEAKLLVNEIKYTPYISGYSDQEWLSCPHVFVAENSQGELVGACLNDDFYPDWSEIAALFVLRKHRNKGIGKDLFEASYQDGYRRNKNIFVISSNPLIVKMLKKYNFVISNDVNGLYNNPYNKYYFILNYFYKIRWFMNLYRIQEFYRKRIFYPVKIKSIYGLKINPQLN